MSRLSILKVARKSFVFKGFRWSPGVPTRFG